ncbi:D-alanyl-lipoteichoic acid biosynthesis protein DltB [Anaerotruncus colihominis]|uniref:D-alanyl-lipoteichoic acid biosynthesis protein DltB n=1 Tax=Anaerotruncus colihominis TaxID=169435 RepID=A0A845SXU0_9FIRM|nr:D-alanyl-lipoteichoic acid biosynthesis protein DltB [Anaerotruncus colihominis]MCR2024156.1 D-alanyl-lipoteichoic acid biosynthesis protein DltB [Anaerotruncus colihominis]NDO39294.1 D-alanyl-lipoteichoic acid biosynthesis protein DltB [Anaerotruncus colihominis]
MTPYSGLLFFYLLALLLLPAVVLGLWGKSLRGYSFVFSVLMLVLVFGEGGQLPALIAFYLWEGVIFLLYRRWWEKIPLWLVVPLALLPLALVKVGEVWSAFALFRLLGVSYMTFRAVEVLLNLHDGTVKNLSLFQWSYFLLFFPSISSGPIDRCRRFLSDLEWEITPEEYIELLRRGVWKLVGGAFSAIVLGELIWQYWLAPLPDRGFLPTLSYMYGYTLFLFFNFAGSSSMAVGTGYILGIQVPENFNQPFLSVDMKDFWARWHISLSTWLRDYVYTRFVMDSLKKKRFRNQRTASYLGYLLTMMTMGVWHGLAPRYLAYGAYHSALMCLNEALDLHWKPFKRWKKQGMGQIVCVLVTFHLFAFGLLIFSGRLF